MRKFWFLKLAVIGVAFIFFAGFVVMNLWNWLVPAIFGLTAISFYQALGLLVLSKILFGGFGRGFGCSGYGGKHQYWKQRMSEKWENMTPEQKAEFKKKMKGRFGFWKPDFEAEKQAE